MQRDSHSLNDRRIFRPEEGGDADGCSAAAAAAASRQTVKCPRCESADTKFCYYNNYNLAQPRHFCKSCRRYWTMGGVLRNVPVGGGCRKSKRPSPSSSKPSSLPSRSASSDKDRPRRRRPSASVVSAPFPDPPLPVSQTPASSTDAAPLRPAPAAIFQDPASGGFDPSPAVEKTGAEAEATLPVDPKPSGAGDGLAALDWSGPVEAGLFDLTAAVDPSAYWNQSHWMDDDPSLYLP